MKWDDLSRQRCSVARALAVIGDRWTLMMLRDCFHGVRRFEDFQHRLGISRSIITDRLNLLVEEGVLKREPYQQNPPRYEYRLTPKGAELHPVILSILHWGDVHYAGKAGPPFKLKHKACGHVFDPVNTCSECGEALKAGDTERVAGSVSLEKIEASFRRS